MRRPNPLAKVDFQRRLAINKLRLGGQRLALPPFSTTSILPPFVGSWPEAAIGFSPYQTTIGEVAASFGYTPERRAILVGLLNLRSRLRSAGLIIDGQWLDGSFVEQIEVSEARNPGDLDVVSFLWRPLGAKAQPDFMNVVNANLDLFVPAQAKANFRCDHYALDLDVGLALERICYWHSVFSHRRNGVWKGYVSVQDEGDAVDQALRAHLIAQGLA